jgi:membrane protein implicated in regulation of membrane protease activity
MILTTMMSCFYENCPHISPIWAWVILILITLIIIWILRKLVKEAKHNHLHFLTLKNEVGIVMEIKKDYYQVKIAGEIWNATSEDILALNDRVIVTSESQKYLKLKVKKFQE